MSLEHGSTWVLPLRSGAWERGRTEWQQLYSVTPSATAYLAPEWVDCWLREFAEELHPRQLFFCSDRGDTVGTCLITERVSYRSILPFVRGYLNTDGEKPQDRVVIEYNAPLASSTDKAVVWTQLAAHVIQSSMDELVIAGAEEDTVSHALGSFAGWKADIEWRDSPFVDLHGLRVAGRDHESVLSSNTRAQLRRSMRRYESRGQLRLEVASNVAEALVMFDQMLILHEQHWSRRGEAGGFSSPHRMSFHRAFIREAHSAGRVDLIRVMMGSEVLGVLYNLVANGHVAFYQSGFLYEDDPQLKPGMVTHHLAIGYYLASGYREYDFLPSGPRDGRYKLSLATSCRRLATVTLSRPGWRSRYFDALRSIRRTAVRVIKRR